jgi:hypothetical protein
MPQIIRNVGGAEQAQVVDKRLASSVRPPYTMKDAPTPLSLSLTRRCPFCRGERPVPGAHPAAFLRSGDARPAHRHLLEKVRPHHWAPRELFRARGGGHRPQEVQLGNQRGSPRPTPGNTGTAPSHEGRGMQGFAGVVGVTGDKGRMAAQSMCLAQSLSLGAKAICEETAEGGAALSTVGPQVCPISGDAPSSGCARRRGRRMVSWEGGRLRTWRMGGAPPQGGSSGSRCAACRLPGRKSGGTRGRHMRTAKETKDAARPQQDPQATCTFNCRDRLPSAWVIAGSPVLPACSGRPALSPPPCPTAAQGEGGGAATHAPAAH